MAPSGFVDAAGAATGARTRNITVGHTSITWLNEQTDRALQEIGELGFSGFETFPWNLEKLEAAGGLDERFQAAGVPLVSGYCVVDLTNISRRKEELEQSIRWAQLLRRYGARIFVLGPNSLDRSGFDFKPHKPDIVNMLNEVAMAITDLGLTPVLHQHTGTCIETRDETYATLDAVKTDVLKFGPDVGQLLKGGADPLQVVKDYLPIIEHLHLKDYDGKNPRLLGYCPLGQGRVDIPAILDLMQVRPLRGMVMGELDNDWDHPDATPAVELVRQSQQYLQSIGVKFRA